LLQEEITAKIEQNYIKIRPGNEGQFLAIDTRGKCLPPHDDDASTISDSDCQKQFQKTLCVTAS
jgi:hypothetical protein